MHDAKSGISFDTAHETLDGAKAFAEKLMESSIVGGWQGTIHWGQEKVSDEQGDIMWCATTYSQQCDQEGCPVAEVSADIQNA